MKLFRAYCVALLLVSLLAVMTGCTSSQSARGSASCSGGLATATFSTIKNSNVNSSTFRTEKVMAQSSAVRSGYVFVASVCPVEARGDRTITFALTESPQIGKTYTLTSATVEGSNYLDYAELVIDPSTSTMKSMNTWMASGVISVESIDGPQVTFSADNLVMNKRPSAANAATGSFLMDLNLTVDNLNESSVRF